MLLQLLTNRNTAMVADEELIIHQKQAATTTINHSINNTNTNDTNINNTNTINTNNDNNITNNNTTNSNKTNTHDTNTDLRVAAAGERHDLDRVRYSL